VLGKNIVDDELKRGFGLSMRNRAALESWRRCCRNATSVSRAKHRATMRPYCSLSTRIAQWCVRPPFEMISDFGFVLYGAQLKVEYL
jgi:hypothetical protein